MESRRIPNHRFHARAIAAWLAVAGGALAACGEAEVNPSPAGPFTPVTIGDGGFCRSDESGQARSEAFTEPVTLTRAAGGALDGTATVANVPEGRYTIDVECASGRTSRSTFRVDSMPTAVDTGTSPDGTNALQWTAGVLFVGGLATIGCVVMRRRADVDPVV